MEKKKKDKSSVVVHAVVSPPSLKDNTGDVDRLKSELGKMFPSEPVDIDLSLQRFLPGLLRKHGYQVQCPVVRTRTDRRVAGVFGSAEKVPLFGVAVDLGTTKVVMRLIDIEKERTAGEISFDNPQVEVGPDILTRVHYAENGDGLSKLSGMIVSGLNHGMETLCRKAEIGTEDIYMVSVAGNTTMTHLFIGLPPRNLIREPYIPVTNNPGIIPARQLGLQVNPSAQTIVFPNIGSYFGGDLIAGLLFSEIWEKDETSILVDVGTNAEVVLGNRDWLIACAGAAGPALEGGVTKMGMTARPGVIDRIRIDSATDRIRFHTIGDEPPIGICGTGLIDLASELFKTGMIDIRGKFASGRCGSRLVEKDNIRHIIVVPAEESGTNQDLLISEVDLDSLVRSKAAMYTILETIAMTVGMELSELDAFCVAGTFGSVIDPSSAVTIGMIPDLPLEKFRVLGNSSLEGASRALIDPEALEKIERIRTRITYLELNVNQDFMNRFSAARFLPHTNRALFPSVQTVDPN